MRKYILFLCVLLKSFTAQAQLIGKVISIADGDTFTLLVDSTQVKIRLHGIDCPEKRQDFGQVAKKFLSEMVFNKIVHKTNRDRYGRTIGIVFIDNINVNEGLLKAGLAWHYKKYDHNSVWTLLEDIARAEKKGLWSIANPLPPWDWRKLRR